MMKKLLLALFVALSLAQPASAAEPLTWLKGGYGENIRSYEILKCASLPGHQSPKWANTLPCKYRTDYESHGVFADKPYFRRGC